MTIPADLFATNTASPCFRYRSTLPCLPVQSRPKSCHKEMPMARCKSGDFRNGFSMSLVASPRKGSCFSVGSLPLLLEFLYKADQHTPVLLREHHRPSSPQRPNFEVDDIAALLNCVPRPTRCGFGLARHGRGHLGRYFQRDRKALLNGRYPYVQHLHPSRATKSAS